jgi:hypothetical protein|tara:strand:- start:33 stop:212 length:180 start_codon:yes stop_codon:yes gene_type:complete
MKPLYYYLNKYFYFPPYLLWVWIGRNIGFKGMTYCKRSIYMNELENQLGELINDTNTNN